MDIITLNIGGTNFITTKDTLRNKEHLYPDQEPTGHFLSSLADMTTDTTIFIDRDPTYFKYVLNYLRSGCILPLSISLPQCYTNMSKTVAVGTTEEKMQNFLQNYFQLREFISELKFYSLNQLATYLCESYQSVFPTGQTKQHIFRLGLNKTTSTLLQKYDYITNNLQAFLNQEVITFKFKSFSIYDHANPIQLEFRAISSAGKISTKKYKHIIQNPTKNNPTHEVSVPISELEMCSDGEYMILVIGSTL